jgi:anti-anti-sigma factor
MEIIRQPRGNVLVLNATGRLDAYWASHLGNEISDVLRQGARHIELNLKEVPYISSAGIRVLLQSHKQLRGIEGSFAVTEPSDGVKAVLELAGVAELLVEMTAARPAQPAETSKDGSALERDNTIYQVLHTVPDAAFKSRVIGNPGLLAGCRYLEENCHDVPFGEAVLGVGLGAFGNDFVDSQARFGEFVAVAGSAAYLPTDGTNVPDYSLSKGDFVPRLQVLYGVACEGEFSKIVQFERKDKSRRVKLHEIVETCQEIAGDQTIALAMLMESAGLMGASLLRSPALPAPVGAPFDHPEIRQWLSFTSERAYSRSLTLVVGIAAPITIEKLNPMLRPLANNSPTGGHFHAATFSYRPLRRGETNLKNATTALFEAETLQGVLHLINDERQISGAGESEFLRGACWIGPITEISTDGN